MGRPSKLTNELQKKICEFIAQGNYIETACAAAGIGVSTYHLWMAKGRKAKSGKYVEFLAAIKKAEQQAQARYVKIIHDAAETTWQAAAWYLERKHPNLWGRKERHEISGGEKPIAIDATISIEDIRKLEIERGRIINEASGCDDELDTAEVSTISERERNGGKGIAIRANNLDVFDFIHRKQGEFSPTANPKHRTETTVPSD